MDEALNICFLVFHTLWIAFNCVGWGWRQTRRWHLATLALTALSWFGLGAFYGWGYCPCTDWHWQVRERLGYRDPPSYVQLLIGMLTGKELDTESANVLALGTLIIAGVATAIVNVRDRRPRARNGRD